MTTKAASYVQGRRLRVTKLDECGRPIEGDSSVVVSKGFTTIGYTANTDEGEEINVQNASGETCVRVPARPTFLGYTVEVTFCQVDPDLFSLLTGQRTIVDANGDVVGFTMDSAISAADVHFALEVWVGAPGGDSCDDPNASGSYGYVLLPFVQGGVVGDFSVENAEVTFSVTGAATLDGSRWGTGYHNAVLDGSGNPSVLAEALTSTEHLLLTMTSLAPPTPLVGARPYLPIGDPEVTGSTASATLLSVDFDPSPAGAGEAFWVEFGDGEWAYSSDGSTLTHEYAEAGTYTYTIYRGGTSFTDSITVTAS